jgi:hypothetical protein
LRSTERFVLELADVALVQGRDSSVFLLEALGEEQTTSGRESRICADSIEDFTSAQAVVLFNAEPAKLRDLREGTSPHFHHAAAGSVYKSRSEPTRVS